MKFRAVIGLVTAVLFIGLVSGLQNRRAWERAAEREGVLSEDQFNALMRNVARRGLAARVDKMKWMVSPEGGAALQEEVGAMMFPGIGIQYGADLDGDNTWRPRVLGVFKGSSADKAGIEPGDWLVSIDGTDVYKSCVAKDGDPCPNLGGKDSVRDLIRAAGNRLFVIEVGRPGDIHRATVRIGTVGEAMQKCAAKKVALLEPYRQENAFRVRDFAAEADKATDETTDELLERAKAMQFIVQAPWDAVRTCRDERLAWLDRKQQ
jgi:C-terminal processing protease CtpA/Prc